MYLDIYLYCARLGVCHTREARRKRVSKLVVAFSGVRQFTAMPVGSQFDTMSTVRHTAPSTMRAAVLKDYGGEESLHVQSDVITWINTIIQLVFA